MRWTVRLEGGPRRVNHAAARVAGVVYSLGGYCSSGGFSDDERLPVYALDVGTLRWRSVLYRRSMHTPRQRYGHTAIAYRNKIYMWGGRDNREAYDTLSVLDITTLEWSTGQVSGSVPFAKDGHSACLIGDRMYIFGGFESTTDQYSQQVHHLNLTTLVWTLVDTRGPAPSPRDFHTAVAIGHKMYIFGGRGDLSLFEHSNSDVYDPDLYCLDTLSNEWVKLAPLGDWPEGRRSHSAWLHNGDMYIFGGYNLHLGSHFNDVYRYSPKEDRWCCVHVRGTKPCKRRRSACATHESKLYLFGGTSPAELDPDETMDSEDVEEKMIDNSDLHILDFSPSLRTLGILTALQLGLDQTNLPYAIKCDIKAMTLPSQISKPITQSG